MLKENYDTVCQKVDKACENAGRERTDVTLIAVSKTKPVEMVKEIYDLGCRMVRRLHQRTMLIRQRKKCEDYRLDMG